ncbi:hypothetical protein ABI_28570 [Asticcacaulis biprosthecium C19]|uniref:Uncharacterized protein n=1 Tax=Asticcacaulis biprosthecium C19 TaxID=715226 RepID=F4QMK0_9CAUL|nr:hypothetical protein ABI_28570 [Asticcacaulis biprosthecium C19]
MLSMPGQEDPKAYFGTFGIGRTQRGHVPAWNVATSFT